jgi:hypothetical protein
LLHAGKDPARNEGYMNGVDAVVRAYGAAWMDVDNDERRRLLEMAWSEDGVYQDPTADVSGREALVQHIVGFRQRLPGSKIVITSGVDHHHGKIHFLWKMIGPDGQTTLEGRDFGELDRNGRICRIAGFFGSPPMLADVSGQ